MSLTRRGIIAVADAPGCRNGSVYARGHIAALEHVANRPIVHHVYTALAAAGLDEIVVAAPSELVGEVRSSLNALAGDAAGPTISFVDRPGPMDFMEAIALAAPAVGSAPCIAHLASGMLGDGLRPFAEHLRDDSPDLALLVNDPGIHGKHLHLETQDTIRLSEPGPSLTALDLAGVFLFGRGALQQLGSAGLGLEHGADPGSLAEQITTGGGSFRVRFVDGWRRYAGDPDDLLALNQLALDGLEPGSRPQVCESTKLEGRAQIDPSACVQSSVIVGPVVIGPGATVTEAYLGPYTTVGEGARIEGVEIERSIIFPGASVMHVGGRMAGSIVGRDARVFRDFSLPRALRLRVGEGDEIALC
jgi:glucose-1-phosphate thymidylyltransferase